MTMEKSTTSRKLAMTTRASMRFEREVKVDEARKLSISPVETTASEIAGHLTRKFRQSLAESSGNGRMRMLLYVV